MKTGTQPFFLTPLTPNKQEGLPTDKTPVYDDSVPEMRYHREESAHLTQMNMARAVVRVVPITITGTKSFWLGLWRG